MDDAPSQVIDRATSKMDDAPSQVIDGATSKMDDAPSQVIDGATSKMDDAPSQVIDGATSKMDDAPSQVIDGATSKMDDAPSQVIDGATSKMDDAPSQVIDGATSKMDDAPSQVIDGATSKMDDAPSQAISGATSSIGNACSKLFGGITGIFKRKQPSQTGPSSHDAPSSLPSPTSGAAASDCSKKQPSSFDCNPMALIPSVSRRDFISDTARKEITENPAAAVDGKNVYRGMLNEGKVKMYRQKITGMDNQTLKKLLNTINDDWGLGQDIFPGFEELIKNVLSNETITTDKKEEIEMSPDYSECLVYNLQSDQASGKYHFAICHIAADLPFNKATAVGGLMLEGLLGKDEKKNLYLQF